MAETLDYTYYDSVSSGTTASASLIFFNQSESGTNKQTTNMPVAGRLLATESFDVTKIYAYFESDTLTADLIKLLDKCVLEFLIQENRVLALPLILCAPNTFLAADASTLNQTATVQSAGITGGPFELKVPIKIPKGASFKVRIKIGEGASPTASDIKVALRGKLTRE